MEKGKHTQEEIGQAFGMLAQGVINISEGLTEIEKGSPIFAAMITILEHVDEFKAAQDMLDALKATYTANMGQSIPPAAWLGKVISAIRKAKGKNLEDRRNFPCIKD